jgi:hypothetical protein
MRIRKYLALLFPIVFSSFCLAAVTPGRTDFIDYCTGSNNSNCVFQIDASGNVTGNNLTAQGYVNTLGNIVSGPVGVSQSTATSTSNTAQTFAVFISSLSSLAPLKGMVIVSTTPIAGQGISGVTGSATNTLTTFIGVADVASATNTVVNVDYGGIAVALTTGTVNPGDLLVTTNTAAGYLGTNNSASAGQIVARALSSGISSGGLTRVLLRP